MAIPCRQLATILKGKVSPDSNENLCIVDRDRELDVSVLGRKTQSPLVLGMEFSFEDGQETATLNLAEIILLQREVNPFIMAIRQRNIRISALHNHWMFETPRLMYLHLEAISDPVSFATAIAEALEAAGVS